MGTNAEFAKEDDIYQSIGTTSYDQSAAIADQMLPQITARINVSKKLSAGVETQGMQSNAHLQLAEHT